MANESQALDEISRAAFALLLNEPFYAHILAGMPREASDTVKTTGTAWDGQQVRLRVNPEFFVGGLTAPQRTGVLKHEILHAVIPSYRDEAGRWVHHPPEFREREQSWPEYGPAVEWERRNLTKLIRSAREGGSPQAWA